jgi:hypothetical protein
VQFASFDLDDPVFDALGLRLSVQLVSLENLYGVDPARVQLETDDSTVRIRADGLRWAGGRERAEGRVEVEIERIGAQRWRLAARARAPVSLRCVKFVLRDLEPPDGVPSHGELLAYPQRLPAPIIRVRFGGDWLGARAADPQVREKRFAVYTERLGPLAGRGALELIHEEAASRFAESLEVPDFFVARGEQAGSLEDEHATHLALARGLQPWEERPDVPDWARDLQLVVTLHGMHWSGRVFLSYERMREILAFVTERIEGRRVLIYLPGWEGRYYWQYGDYRPEPRLGGDRGFAALCDAARAAGAHLMPMFGAHCANAWLPRFRDLDPAVFLKSATRNRFHGNLPDWDLSRAHDTGWQAWLNPGHPVWREILASQIEALAARFGFDAVFLDTTEIWTNDADHPVTDGLVALASRLRGRIADLLLAGEYDYDALLPVFPLFQRAWWTAAPPWTARFIRRFGHLCEGEPRGRTGVHELGVFRPGPVAADPDAGLLPTIAFQDDTLESSKAVVERAIAAAASAHT